MQRLSLLAVLILLLASCTSSPIPSQAQSQSLPPSTGKIINSEGKTMEKRIQTPKSFTRLPASSLSQSEYFRKLPLKPDGAPVLYYNGAEKPNNNIYAAVLDLEIGKTDLLQCADAVMRLRADWLYATHQHARIHFNFTNGFTAQWAKWKLGNRIYVKGNVANWVKTAQEAGDQNTFTSYLTMVYTYAGTLSLSREMKTVPFTEIHIGDVLIQGGSPGHAVTVMDMATDGDGNKIYLLSQSYMPAQDIQILQNPGDKSISPWYRLTAAAGNVQTPQWLFTTTDLKRFAD